MVLQALEGLSDREAISALRRDIAWKVACGLRLDDEGFHPTVLVYWRNRLRTSSRPRRVFDAVRQVVAATGVLKGRGRRVLDSTILADAVATQDTVTQLVAAVRRVRRLVPRAREVALTAHDYDRPGKPECAWDDPQAIQALVSGLVNDALAVLEAVADLTCASPRSPSSSATPSPPPANTTWSPARWRWAGRAPRSGSSTPIWGSPGRRPGGGMGRGPGRRGRPRPGRDHPGVGVLPVGPGQRGLVPAAGPGRDVRHPGRRRRRCLRPCGFQRPAGAPRSSV